MGNIKDEPAYDPFPKTGLVKQYEGFIRQWVHDFCKQYPRVRREEALIEAVRIADDFARTKFKPELGYDFSTPLRHHLKGLHRILVENEEKQEGIRAETKEEKEAREAEERGEPTRPVNFAGGNGARVTFDLQWTRVTPTGIVESTYSGDRGVPARVTRHRVVSGVQLNSGDAEYVLGVTMRVSADLPTLLDGQQPSPKLSGQMRAVIDHLERRQREADQEAENRRNGSYDPVFLEPKDSRTDIAFYKGKKPPKLAPTYIPNAQLDDAYSHDDGWVGKLSDTIADGGRDEAEKQECRLRHAAVAERPFLSPTEAAMLDWAMDPRGRTQSDLAAEIGITKGAASKMYYRVAQKIAKRFNGES